MMSPVSACNYTAAENWLSGAVSVKEVFTQQVGKCQENVTKEVVDACHVLTYHVVTKEVVDACTTDLPCVVDTKSYKPYF